MSTESTAQPNAAASASGSAGIGDIYRNRYGLLLRVLRVEKRGVVRVFGHNGSWDIHAGITEWHDLSKNWKPNNEMSQGA